MHGYENSRVPRLFELLEQRNIKAIELSKATGIRTGSITDWKLGKSVPSGDRLIAVANYFGVTSDYILGSDASPDVIVEDQKNSQILIELEKLDDSQKDSVLNYIRFLQNKDQSDRFAEMRKEISEIRDALYKMRGSSDK